MISSDDITALLSALGYKEQNNDTWSKQYHNHDYIIEIDFNKEKIIYPPPIELGDKTTSNFANSENFVVLECVDRLLTKGYKPQALTLEHKWPMGKQHKGKLDILVRDATNDKTYLMIECKTWGEEYEKEKKRMQKDGGQLFSYYQQDKNAKYLCLYTSRLHERKVKYHNDIVQIDDVFKNLGEVKEVYTRWNKQFSNNGIFDADIQPYRITLKALKREDLKLLQEGDDSIIYNHFLEILRHNVVSDKGNAFNKIFNLFLCKILDEDKNDDAEMDLQWIEGKDNYISLLSRLNDLYKMGMKKYLEKEITDYTQEDIEQYQADKKIYTILQELRLYKNQEFAFAEVFDQASFEENARIVKEVVQLLQGWQIRYTQKQQFLSDFFELLLNTGFKQESGQFFSPVPLVRFIIQSLPLEEVIQEKIHQGENNFLPYVIDFACGSGHFLTEMMDILQKKIDRLDKDTLTPSQRGKLEHFQKGDFDWADKYIYGIERDYRLVKTTKLACFLHGDGEAKIAHASGLAPFNDERYKEKLKLADDQIKAGEKTNPQFDLLVTNPPYSVKGFRSTVKKGEESFDLFKHISDASSEIEVLFVERMTQLVKPNGYVAIILPQSILSNAGNYARARTMILEHFRLKSLTLLGNNAFMATGTNTVVFFLKKRRQPKHLAKKTDYQAMAKDELLVVVDSGEKEIEKRFLGYEFSSRRGSEGIKLFDEGGVLDEENLDNPAKANSYILRNMRDENITDIDTSLKGHVQVMPLADCFDWEADIFTNAINPKKKQFLASKYPLVKLGDVSYINSNRVDIVESTEYNYIDISSVENITGKLNIPQTIKGRNLPSRAQRQVAIGDVLMSTVRPHLKAFFYLQKLPLNPIASTGFAVITPKKSILGYFIYALLFSDAVQQQMTAKMGKSSYPSLNQTDVEELLIPFPPLAEQQEIVKELNSYQKIIDGAKETIENYVPEFETKEAKKVKFSEFISLNYGKGLPKSKRIEGEYPVIGSNGIDGYHNGYIAKSPCIVVGRKGSAGSVNLIEENCFPIDTTFYVECDPTKWNYYYLYYYLFSLNLKNMKSGIGAPGLNRESVYQLNLKMPPLAEQQKIVDKLNAEQADIESQKALIKQMEEKIQRKLDSLWQEVE